MLAFACGPEPRGRRKAKTIKLPSGPMPEARLPHSPAGLFPLFI